MSFCIFIQQRHQADGTQNTATSPMLQRCASCFVKLENTHLMTVVNYKDWVFEVDEESTENTYRMISGSGAETCKCNYCKNYVAYRDKVFPDEIKKLFSELRIDYRKEVEITTYETLPNGLHHIGGWFHFKGQVLKGKDYRIPLPGGGDTFDLTRINDRFSIGFAEGSDLTFFEEKSGLVQVEFNTNVPWVIHKSLEVGN